MRKVQEHIEIQEDVDLKGLGVTLEKGDRIRVVTEGTTDTLYNYLVSKIDLEPEVSLWVKHSGDNIELSSQSHGYKDDFIDLANNIIRLMGNAFNLNYTIKSVNDSQANLWVDPSQANRISGINFSHPSHF